jgi:hypothetical protein
LFFSLSLSLSLLLYERYQKFVSEEPQVQIANLTKALNEYKIIDEYAKKYNPKSLKVEIQLCKQMLDLLPEKIQFLSKPSP